MQLVHMLSTLVIPELLLEKVRTFAISNCENQNPLPNSRITNFFPLKLDFLQQNKHRVKISPGLRDGSELGELTAVQGRVFLSCIGEAPSVEVNAAAGDAVQVSEMIHGSLGYESSLSFLPDSDR